MLKCTLNQLYFIIITYPSYTSLYNTINNGIFMYTMFYIKTRIHTYVLFYQNKCCKYL